MRNIFFVVIISLIQNHILIGQNWVTLSDASGTPAYRHDDVYFTSADTGYTVLYNSSNQIGYIYKTTNRGISWSVVKQSNGTHFRCITFLDAQTGFVGNLGKGSFDNASDTIPIYFTKDAGTTWTPLNPDPKSQLKGLCAMYKVNDSTLYTVGRVRGPAFLLKTKNRGKSWETIDLTPFGLGAAMDVYFANVDTGFVVGMNEGSYLSGTYNGRIIMTTDGGKTWEKVLNGNDNQTYFWKISFPSKLIGYATLQQNTIDYKTVIYFKTTDGGLHWTKNMIPTSLFGLPVNFYTQGIHFVDEKKGWIGGGGGSINFVETTDGGNSWTNITNNNSYRINKLRGFGDSVVFASGVRIQRLAYSPLTNGLNETKQTEAIVSIYPNPSSELVTIQINKAVWTNASLRIFTENGAFISEASLDEHISQINVSDFPKGLYFFKLQNQGKFWISKVRIE